MGLIGNDPTHPEGSGFTVRPGSPAPAQTHIAPSARFERAENRINSAARLPISPRWNKTLFHRE